MSKKIGVAEFSITGQKTLYVTFEVSLQDVFVPHKVLLSMSLK